MSTRKNSTTQVSKAKETPSAEDSSTSVDPSRAGSLVFEQVQARLNQNRPLSTVPQHIIADRPMDHNSEGTAPVEPGGTFIHPSERFEELGAADGMSNFQTGDHNNAPMHIVVNSKEAITLTSLTDHTILRQFRSFCLTQNIAFDSRRYILADCVSRWPNLEPKTWFASNIAHSLLWDWYVTKVTNSKKQHLAEHLQLTVEKITFNVRDASIDLPKVQQYIVQVNEAISAHTENSGAVYDHRQCIRAVVNMLKAQRSSSQMMEYIYHQVVAMVSTS